MVDFLDPNTWTFDEPYGTVVSNAMFSTLEAVAEIWPRAPYE